MARDYDVAYDFGGEQNYYDERELLDCEDSVLDDEDDDSTDSWIDSDVYAEDFDDEPDQFRDDVDADADTLASAGYGTDEDYGYYEDERDFGMDG